MPDITAHVERLVLAIAAMLSPSRTEAVPVRLPIDGAPGRKPGRP